MQHTCKPTHSQYQSKCNDTSMSEHYMLFFFNKGNIEGINSEKLLFTRNVVFCIISYFINGKMVAHMAVLIAVNPN